MNILIPMAGIGARFRNAGYSIPKPLIPVQGRPMYAWAVDSLPLKDATQVIFVLLENQPEYNNLQADIISRYGKYNHVILSVPTVTAGQSVTCLVAEQYVDNDEPLCIHNADTAFSCDPLWARLAKESGIDGALLVFESQEQRWSFSREDDAGWVIEVREKKVISPWASTGTYWFRRGGDFVRLARATIDRSQKEGGEYYVGPLYNDLIKEGGRIRNIPIQTLLCFGTPADLQRSLNQLCNKETSPSAR